jgi:hypothetical protein
MEIPAETPEVCHGCKYEAHCIYVVVRDGLTFCSSREPPVPPYRLVSRPPHVVWERLAAGTIVTEANVPLTLDEDYALMKLSEFQKVYDTSLVAVPEKEWS